MAKKKKRLDDDDLDLAADEPADEAIDIEKEAVEVTDESVAPADADLEDSAADALSFDTDDADAAARLTAGDGGADAPPGDGGDDGEPGDGEPKEEPEEEKVRPRVPRLALVLCVACIVFASLYALLALMRLQRSQETRYQTHLYDLALQGLPTTKDEASFLSAQLLPHDVNVSPAAVQQAYTNRVPSGGGKEPFRSVDAISRHRPTLTPRLMSDLFSGGTPVESVADEAERVQTELFARVEEIAGGYGKGANEARKRDYIRFFLLTLANDTAQIDALDRYVQSLQPAAVDALLRDAGQRRMLVDLLRVLQWNRPLKEQQKLLPLAADPTKVPLPKLKEMVKEHFDAALQPAPVNVAADQRPFYEQRQHLAFLLTAAAHLQKPLPEPEDPNKKDSPLVYKLVDEQAPDRARVVLGLIDYAKATQALARGLRELTQHTSASEAENRGGVAFDRGDGKLGHLPGFVQKHGNLVDQLVELVGRIEVRKQHLQSLQDELKVAKDTTAARQKDYEAVLQKLLKIRQETAALAGDLRELEQQLFAAQRVLSGAGRENQRLERELRKAEQLLRETSAP